MKTTMGGATNWVTGIALGATLLWMGGCAQSGSQSAPESSSAQVSNESHAGAPDAPASGQKTFSSDDEAAKAMVDAARDENHDQVHEILGPAWKELVSGDKVEDANAFKDFSEHAAQRTRLEKKDASTSVLYIGDDDWPFPIPVVKSSDGKWFFDTEAGKAEILARRIGANELGAIDVCQAYVRAQRQYARHDHDSMDLPQYAQHLVSSSGKHNGLYWEAESGQESSPFGPLVADAEMEGYQEPQAGQNHHEPYHGYHFRILKAQGSAAPGGKYSYVIHGNMVAGFALVAFPDKYGSSGIMTFIVNQNGKVYQKDLGPDTTRVASQMTEYNPDKSWSPAQD